MFHNSKHIEPVNEAAGYNALCFTSSVLFYASLAPLAAACCTCTSATLQTRMTHLTGASTSSAHEPRFLDARHNRKAVGPRFINGGSPDRGAVAYSSAMSPPLVPQASFVPGPSSTAASFSPMCFMFIPLQHLCVHGVVSNVTYIHVYVWMGSCSSMYYVCK